MMLVVMTIMIMMINEIKRNEDINDDDAILMIIASVSVDNHSVDCN